MQAPTPFDGPPWLATLLRHREGDPFRAARAGRSTAPLTSGGGPSRGEGGRDHLAGRRGQPDRPPRTPDPRLGMDIGAAVWRGVSARRVDDDGNLLTDADGGVLTEPTARTDALLW